MGCVARGEVDWVLSPEFSQGGFVFGCDGSAGLGSVGARGFLVAQAGALV
jgi:hypothetical protein